MRERRLDLAKLDAKAADLDLIVDAAAKGEIAVLVQNHRVAGAIEHGVGAVRVKWVGDKLLGRQRVALEIALGDAGAADQQFAFHAGADQIQRVVDDIAAVIGDRPADRHRLLRPDFRDRRDDGGLGRAVAVVDHAADAGPARGDGRRTGLAAQNNRAQGFHVARQHREQRRHCVEHGDPGLLQNIRQQLGLAQNLRRRDEQRRADEIGNPDLLHREVEGDRGALEHHVGGGDAINLVGRAQIMADVAPCDDDPLGRAGRTRGVDEIGGAVRGRAALARIGQRTVAHRRDFGVDQHGNRDAAARLAREGGGGQQPLGLGVGETDGDALDRRVGVEG